MAVTLQELLQPQFILDLISRVRPGQGALSQWLGFGATNFNAETVSLSGPATVSGDLRTASYRVFNSTRTPMKARAPGTGPSTRAPNPLGNVSVDCCRFHEKIPLNYELLGNLSPMTGPNSQIGEMGQSYLRQQTVMLANNGNTMVEIMAAGMMRDSLYFIQRGDDWLPTFTAPDNVTTFGFQVPFRIPAGNQNQLNMLGAGNIIDVSWDNVGANILLHFAKIKMAFAQLHGYPLTDVWINSGTWIKIISNTGIRNVAGSSNTPFAQYTNAEERGMDGRPTGRYTAVLAADPTLTFHIYDQVCSLNTGASGDIDISYSYSTGTAAKYIPDNMAIFSTTPSPEIAKLYLGGEPVVENPGMPAVRRRGWYFWHEYATQPSSIELLSLLNAVPLAYVPAVFCPAIVVFP